MKQIQNKILKSESVNWKNLEFLQPDGFKELSKENYEKLRSSIINNNFVESFKIWESGKKLICLDGYHRIQVLKELEKEGFAIPDKLRGDFLDCKSKKEAAKLVLVYSSIYAHTTSQGIYEHMNNFDIDFQEILGETDIPHIDYETFQAEFFNSQPLEEDPKEKELDENVKTNNECPQCGYKW